MTQETTHVTQYLTVSARIMNPLSTGARIAASRTDPAQRHARQTRRSRAVLSSRAASARIAVRTRGSATHTIVRPIAGTRYTSTPIELPRAVDQFSGAAF